MCVSWQVICREHLMKGETKQQVEQVKAAWIFSLVISLFMIQEVQPELGLK